MINLDNEFCIFLMPKECCGTWSQGICLIVVLQWRCAARLFGSHKTPGLFTKKLWFLGFFWWWCLFVFEDFLLYKLSVAQYMSFWSPLLCYSDWLLQALLIHLILEQMDLMYWFGYALEEFRLLALFFFLVLSLLSSLELCWMVSEKGRKELWVIMGMARGQAWDTQMWGGQACLGFLWLVLNKSVGATWVQETTFRETPQNLQSPAFAHWLLAKLLLVKDG